MTGKGKIVRTWPRVSGIGLMGEVVKSQSGGYKAGYKVILTGCRVEEKYWSGYLKSIEKI